MALIKNLGKRKLRSCLLMISKAGETSLWGFPDLVGLKSGQFPFFRFASLSMFFRLGAVEVVLACCFMGTVIPTAPPMDLLFQLCNSSLLFFVFPVLLLELYCFLLSVGSVVARVAFQPGGRKLPKYKLQFCPEKTCHGR